MLLEQHLRAIDTNAAGQGRPVGAADTAQPIATASMSNRTTSSSSRSIQVPP
jgi:hypothetical protein